MTIKKSDESDIRNLQIRQTWLDEQIAAIQAQYGFESLDDAFKALSISLIFDLDYDAIQPEEIVDARQDKQIDVIRIDDDDNRGYAHVHILQAKNNPGFSSNSLIQMRNGLAWIFERPRKEYEKLENPAFVNKIEEIRQLRLDYGASNIAVSVYFVTCGDTGDLSQEFLQERKILIDTFSNAGFSEFNFREIGAFELIELMNEGERAQRKIDVDISIQYDINTASLIQYNAGDTKALICTVSGNELARVASFEPRDAIFDLNVRPFYGSRGRVNKEIRDTCTGTESQKFWFLNNGVTMVCDDFDLITDPDNTTVKTFNAQIVNGCQTSVTLREAWERKELREDTKVLLKIYATDNPNLAGRITLTTNNQNRITDRDLRANDPIQIDIQRIAEEKYDYFYERKNRQFRGLRGQQRKRIIPNYKSAQAYLAIVRQKPSVARGYLGKIWSDYYQEIYSNATVEDLIGSYLIYKFCYEKAKSARRNANLSRLESEIAVYGTFHLARICGYLYMDDAWGNRNRQSVKNHIKAMEKNGSELESIYNEAFAILKEIRKNDLTDYPNPTLYFKAGEVQKKLGKTIAKIKNP